MLKPDAEHQKRFW